jgi:hypothetical protein
MQQAGIGSGYIKNIVNQRISTFMQRSATEVPDAVRLVVRKAFNPNGISAWFTSVVAIINQLTLLTVVLTGAAVLREREHGTLEHLLVMPLTAFEIAIAKVWSNGLVILLATGLSLFLVVRTALKVPFAGSMPLWFGLSAVRPRRGALELLRRHTSRKCNRKSQSFASGLNSASRPAGDFQKVSEVTGSTPYGWRPTRSAGNGPFARTKSMK